MKNKLTPYTFLRLGPRWKLPCLPNVIFIWHTWAQIKSNRPHIEIPIFSPYDFHLGNISPSQPMDNPYGPIYFAI